MKRAVIWSREALDDIKVQVKHIAKDSPAAATRVADQIRDTGKALGEFATGRPGRVTGIYEKSVPRLPYIIAYEITSHGGQEVIAVLHVIHTSRDWPTEEWPS